VFPLPLPPCLIFLALLLFSLPIVLFSLRLFYLFKARTHAPLTVEAPVTTAEGPEVANLLCPCPFFVLVSLFLSPFRPRPRHLFPCLLPRRSSFLVKDASPPTCRGRSYNRGRPKGYPPICALAPSLYLSLCSCPLSALAHDTYLPVSFLDALLF
jgi:hypothetical protein